jgi:hypothetical protein
MTVVARSSRSENHWVFLNTVREHVAPVGIELSQLHDGPHTKAAALQSRPIVDLMRCDVGRVGDPSKY